MRKGKGYRSSRRKQREDGFFCYVFCYVCYLACYVVYLLSARQRRRGRGSGCDWAGSLWILLLDLAVNRGDTAISKLNLRQLLVLAEHKPDSRSPSNQCSELAHHIYSSFFLLYFWSPSSNVPEPGSCFLRSCCYHSCQYAKTNVSFLACSVNKTQLRC